MPQAFGPSHTAAPTNDSLVSARVATERAPRSQHKTLLAAPGARSKGPSARQALSGPICGGPACRQGAGRDDLWSSLQGLLCSDSVSRAGSNTEGPGCAGGPEVAGRAASRRSRESGELSASGRVCFPRSRLNLRGRRELSWLGR